MNPDIVTIARRALAEHQGRDLTDPLAAASAAASYEIALRNLLRELDAAEGREDGPEGSGDPGRPFGRETGTQHAS